MKKKPGRPAVISAGIFTGGAGPRCMVAVMENARNRLSQLSAETGWGMGLIAEASIRAFALQDRETRKQWIKDALSEAMDLVCDAAEKE